MNFAYLTLNFAAELSRGEGDREVECCGTISIVELEFSPPNSGKCLVLFDGKKVRWLLHGIDQCGYAMAWALRGEQGADDPPHPSKPKVTLRDLTIESARRGFRGTMEIHNYGQYRSLFT